MAAAVVVRRGDGTSGNVKAKIETIHVSVTGADPATNYYLLADGPAGVDDLKSYVFSPDSTGKHDWVGGIVLPGPGAWTMRLRKASDNSDVATQAVTAA